LSVTVPLRVVGECIAIKQNSAVLNQSVYELEIECLPREIPDALEVDISALNEGEGFHAVDIPLPEGVVLKSDPTQSVVSIVAQKGEEETSPAEDAAPGAETTETPAAE
jgi:large subunit ribosomal protein L25